jgi:8-amino-7-oxononanoate synthase
VSLDWVSDELAAIERSGLLRDPHTVASAAGPEVEVDGRRVVLLCSNNYLGLAGDPRVTAAAALAAKRWGAGSGASRLVSGTLDLHRDLEEALAEHEGAEDAVLFSSGYLANLGVLAALTDEDDVVFSDELNHASIVDGCRLSKARVLVYRHRDVAHLKSLLDETPARRRFIVTDTVFSMDGDVAPIDELAALDATLIVDDAHATGVLDGSRADRADVVVGTLSKALGSSGGYVTGSREVATFLRNRARTHVFDTAPVPAAMGAASMALQLMRDEPWRRDHVRKLARFLATELRGLGFDAREPAAAIVPVLVGDPGEAVALSKRLFDAGVLCPAIRPPSVPDGTSRLRVTVMATHTDEHIERALDAFAQRPRSTARRRTSVHGVFVTGTDTGVGKTVVTAAIAATYREDGARVAIFKPLQTGDADDAAWAGAVSGCHAETGVRLREPLAPAVAARLEDTKIDVDAIKARYTDLRRDFDVVVVEGAGGLLVDIDDRLTMADLAAMFELPLVVAARPALGTLNHTALTVEAARARGLDVLGIVISNYPDEPNIAERTNPEELAKIAPLLGVIGTLGAFDVEAGTRPDRFDVRIEGLR